MQYDLCQILRGFLAAADAWAMLTASSTPAARRASLSRPWWSCDSAP